MAQIIDNNLSSAAPRPTLESGEIMDWIADAIGAVCLFGIFFGVWFLAYGFGA